MTATTTSTIAICCYGNSVSLPRPEDGVLGEDTYLAQAASALRAAGIRSVVVFDRSAGFVTAPEVAGRIVRDHDYFAHAADHVVGILQVGIVDCAPRPVPRRVRAWIARLPGPLRGRIGSFLHRHRARLITLGPMWRMTTPEEFAASTARALASLRSMCDHVIVLSLFPTLPSMEDRSPGIGESVQRYREILSTSVEGVRAAPPGATVTLVDPARLVDGEVTDFLTPDGVHVTPAYHALVAEAVCAAISSTVGEAPGGAG